MNSLFLDVVRKTGANPSSVHKAGRSSRRVLQEAVENIAALLDFSEEFLYWTSGGAEGNTWAVASAVARARRLYPNRKPNVLILATEHDSTLLAGAAMVAGGATVENIPVLSTGLIDLNWFKQRLAQNSKSIDLVSISAANNETGVMQPVEEISFECQNAGVALHLDCVQVLGKQKISLRSWLPSYATFSGHKIGAPKGIGFMVVQPSAATAIDSRLLTPLIHGKQQKTLRGGSENALGIGVLGALVRSLQVDPSACFPQELAQWHREFENRVVESIPGTRIHGVDAPRIRNTSFLGFDGVDGDGIVLALDLEGICASSGSACTSGSLDPSHVLLAMGCTKAMARSSVRFSSGVGTRWADFERVLEVLPQILERVRKS